MSGKKNSKLTHFHPTQWTDMWRMPFPPCKALRHGAWNGKFGGSAGLTAPASHSEWSPFPVLTPAGSGAGAFTVNFTGGALPREWD